MAVNIAELREVGSLQNSTSTPSGFGTKDNYSEVSGLGDVRGRLRKLGGRRVADFGEIALSHRWEWIVRYEAGIVNNLNLSSRWVIDNRFFSIDDYELMDNRKRFIRFVLTEKE